MDELEKDLEKLCESVEEFKLVLELLAKYRDVDVVASKLIKKKVEDGLLANLHNANLFQLKTLKGSRYFTYYDMADIEPILDIAIKKAVRRDKMKEIELNNI